MKIAIIGGGLMGSGLAWKLSGPGKHISLFEKESQLGGLATWHDYGHFVWDRFYHVILPQDRDLLGLIDSLGLKDQLHWNQTLTGYYVNQSFYSISNSWEFLTFPALDMFSKGRLAMTILLANQIKDWRKLESISIEDWLVRLGGRKTFERFWKPLLLAKLGAHYKRVSAVFIWTYIKRLFAARDASTQKEQMGYLAGGYKTFFDRLGQKLREQKTHVHLNSPVESILPAPHGNGLLLTANNQQQHFDKVVFTSPVNVLEKIAHPNLVTVSKKGSVEYLGIICMAVLSRKPISPYYVLNIADKNIPFTGVIGMSSLVDLEYTQGLYLTYFPKYVLNTDPILFQKDQDLKSLFLAGLKKMYPGLKDEDLVSVHMNRAYRVQPLQVLNYSAIQPTVRTRHKDFYVLNTSQFSNDTLNNDSVARHLDRFVANFSHVFEGQSLSMMS